MLGNSTDYRPNYVVGVDAPSPDAWPAVLEALLRAELPGTEVTVENGSVLGAGFDLGLYGVTSMSEQLQALAVSHAAGSAALLVAPSVVDLQLRALDVDGSFAAFEQMMIDADAAFTTVGVLPMNPVAVGMNREVALAVADFNARLVDSGMIGPDEASPLLSSDGLFGDAAFYDDFDDGRRGTTGPDPDGLHPDLDGHRRLAAATAEIVLADLDLVCT